MNERIIRIVSSSGIVSYWNGNDSKAAVEEKYDVTVYINDDHIAEDLENVREFVRLVDGNADVQIVTYPNGLRAPEPPKASKQLKKDVEVRLLSSEILEEKLDLEHIPSETLAAQKKHVVRFTFETSDLGWARALTSKLGELLVDRGPAWAKNFKKLGGWNKPRSKP